MIWRVPELTVTTGLSWLMWQNSPVWGVLAVPAVLWWVRHEVLVRRELARSSIVPAGTDISTRREERA